MTSTMDGYLNYPIVIVRWYQRILPRLFGKTFAHYSGLTFKYYKGKIWVFGKVRPEREPSLTKPQQEYAVGIDSAIDGSDYAGVQYIDTDKLRKDKQ